MDQFIWERADLTSLGARDTLAAEIAGIRENNGQATLFHDLAWLLEAEGRSADKVRVYVCRNGREVIAYASFVVQPWYMRFRIGEATMFTKAFERLHLSAGPLFAATYPAQSRASCIERLFRELRQQLTQRQVLYIEGAVTDSEVERAIQAGTTRQLFKVIAPAPRYERSLIRFPATFEEYLGTLNSQTRQGLRRQVRKLSKHLSGKLNLVRCADPAQIPHFVHCAVGISKRTYQWRLLGLGLRNHDEIERTLTQMARYGWTRCYLLECDGTATAFMIGYLYAGTYYYVDVGFDPEWEKWSVGTVLHMEVLRDLIEGAPPASLFDFSTGAGVHKRRFGNEFRAEVDYVLFPQSAMNTFLVCAVTVVNSMSTFVVGMLERLHLKAAVKRLLRRHASDSAE